MKMKTKIKIEKSDEWFGWKKTVEGWNNAKSLASSIRNRSYVELIRFYNFAYEDSQVKTHVRRRIDALSGSKFEYKGNHDIHKLIKYFVETQLFGFSVLEIKDKHTFLVNRKHCNPYSQLIYKREYDTTGKSYANFKDVYQIYTGDLGLFESIVPYVLLKNIALKSFGTFLQRNGSGFKTVKTKGGNDRVKDLRNALKNITSNSGLVLSNEEEFNSYEPSGNSVNLFTEFIRLCDDNIAKLISGTVVGENTSEGSRAKEQVGLSFSDAVTRSDKRQFTEFLETTLNSKIEFLDTVPIDTVLKVADLIVKQGDKVDKESLERLSGLKVVSNLFNDE